MKHKILLPVVSFFSNPLNLRLMLFVLLLAFVVLTVVYGGRIHGADGIPGGGFP